MPPDTFPSKKVRGQFRGRQLESDAVTQIDALLAEADIRRDLLIEYLHLIQDHYHGISRAHVHALAARLKLSQAEVYEVASFYAHFDLVDAPAADLTIRVCDSISCAMAGAEDLYASLQQALPTTVRTQRAPCIGRCDASPAVLVGSRPLTHATLEKVSTTVLARRCSAALPDDYIDYEAYRRQGGYQLLEACHAGSIEVDTVIAKLRQSGLRGLGGAGFPAARKWSILREQGPGRLLVVNIDEGEPGTFKDRCYLQRDPHRMLEGALIAAWAIEARTVYLYLRDEYAEIRLMLTKELDRLRQTGVALPDIQLRRGAGSYVCGEESAMLESIEGKRGMPRQRPPYIAEKGLFGQPTLAHNMETLYWVRDILEKGPEWMAREGRNGRSGLRSYSISGRVNKPGMYRAPAGISLRQLLQEYCGGMQAGHTLYGYFPGGASGGMLPARLDTLPLDFDTLQEHGCFIGSAAVIVFSQADSAKQLALNAMRFFAHESCGQCTPCRVGTARAVTCLQQQPADRKLLQNLADVMSEASICGLGQAASNPLLCAMKYFAHEFEK